MSSGVDTGYFGHGSEPVHPRKIVRVGAQFAFAYTVNIANRGTITAQLESRHWIITDAEGDVQEVRGEGVVGAQPVLRPARSSSTRAGA
jgi:uncharacterized protein affecting Mg2+/Co2+ transport